MKIHTTNYFDTFIQVAGDSPAVAGQPPPSKGAQKSVAALQFELLHNHPYRYTSDELLFKVFAERNELTEAELEQARAVFFSKGQPCLRASPLTKRYGWGVHFDAAGKIALIGSETPAYTRFAADKTIKVLKAMNSTRR